MDYLHIGAALIAVVVLLVGLAKLAGILADVGQHWNQISDNHDVTEETK